MATASAAFLSEHLVVTVSRMTRTAKRRFARELQSIVDGIAVGPTGPVFVHMYDPPAGDVWMDDVIPGKLAALDRNTGEIAWMSPCEVGYGRGFGAGLGAEQDVVVLGPGSRGHLMVRMALADGKLLAAGEIEAFDEAHVFKDVALTVTPRQILAYDSRTAKENWQYGRASATTTSRASETRSSSRTRTSRTRSRACSGSTCRTANTRATCSHRSCP